MKKLTISALLLTALLAGAAMPALASEVTGTLSSSGASTPTTPPASGGGGSSSGGGGGGGGGGIIGLFGATNGGTGQVAGATTAAPQQSSPTPGVPGTGEGTVAGSGSTNQPVAGTVTGGVDAPILAVNEGVTPAGVAYVGAESAGVTGWMWFILPILLLLVIAFYLYRRYERERLATMRR